MRTREVWHLTDEVGPCGRLLNHIFDLSVPHIITVPTGFFIFEPTCNPPNTNFLTPYRQNTTIQLPGLPNQYTS